MMHTATKPDFASMQYTADELNDVVKLLRKQGGERGVERFLRGELTVSAPICNLPIWKTVKLGTRKNADEYRKALQSAGRRIGDWANDILGKPAFTCAQQETDVDLVVLSVADLGFKEGARYDNISTRAVEMGLELCPAEVGPALRLSYGDQPKDEWLRIAMEAIIDSNGGRTIFAMVHGYGGLWLGSGNGDAGRFWHADGRFIFVRRK